MSAPRPYARIHEIAKVISFANLLCFPNGRTPNISGNGVGYNNHTHSDFQNEVSNLHSVSYHNAGANFAMTSEFLPFFNELINFSNAISNIDFTSQLS